MTTFGAPGDSLFAATDRRGEGAGKPIRSGKHEAHQMHDNSIAAWHDFDAAGRDGEVIGALRQIGRPATDREIMRRLGKADINYVRPSVTRMTDAGVLREWGVVKCAETGRTVRCSWFAERGEQ